MSSKQLLLVVGAVVCLATSPTLAQFDPEDATFIGTSGSPALSANFTEPSGVVQISATDLIIVDDGGDVARITTTGNQVWFRDAPGGEAYDFEGVTYVGKIGKAYVLEECNDQNIRIHQWNTSSPGNPTGLVWTIPLSNFDAHDNTAGMSCGTQGGEAITFIPDSEHPLLESTDEEAGIGGLFLVCSQSIGHCWWLDLIHSTPTTFGLRDTMASVAGNQGIAMDTSETGTDISGLAYDLKQDLLYVLKDADDDQLVVVNWNQCAGESSCEGTEISDRYNIVELVENSIIGDDPEGVAIWPQQCTSQAMLEFDVFILFDDPPTDAERVARYDNAITIQCP